MWVWIRLKQPSITLVDTGNWLCVHFFIHPIPESNLCLSSQYWLCPHCTTSDYLLWTQNHNGVGEEIISKCLKQHGTGMWEHPYGSSEEQICVRNLWGVLEVCTMQREPRCDLQSLLEIGETRRNSPEANLRFVLQKTGWPEKEAQECTNI